MTLPAIKGIVDLTGLVAMLLLVAGALAAYTVEWNAPLAPVTFRPALRVSPRDRLSRLKLHSWIGYLAVAITMVHSLVPFLAARWDQFNSYGLWYGVASTSALVIDLPLGQALRSVVLKKRRGWRRLHVWLAIFIALTAVIHAVYIPKGGPFG